MINSISKDIHWLIEAKAQLTNILFFFSHAWFSKENLCQKHRAKRLGVCYKYAGWTCNTGFHFLGDIYDTHVDKIQFLMHDLGRKMLDNNILSVLEMHPSGYM